MCKYLTHCYHDTCDRIHLPNFRAKRPIRSKTPSLEGTANLLTKTHPHPETAKTPPLMPNSTHPSLEPDPENRVNQCKQ